MQFNTYQTGNPNSGGWRFPFGGATSNDALNYRPMGIDSDFLRQVANLGKKDEAKGLLEQLVAPTPLDAPLSGDTGYEPGDRGQQAQANAGGLGSSQMAQTSPGSLGLGYDAKKGAGGFMAGGIPGLIAGVTMNPQAPVYSVMMPGLNGFGTADTNYGSSPNAMGAPDAAQASALADALAAQLAAYESTGGGGMLGDSSLGSAGNAGMDGAGGIGSW